MTAVKIALLGAGNHSRRNHLPALALYAQEHPDAVDLVALCDRRGEVAREAAREYGFARAYTDLGQMLEREQPAGCIAVTPIDQTLSITRQIIEAGVPLLMEKPPGANLDQARQIVELVAQHDVRVMVSVNRRFDLALQEALRHRGDRPLQYLRATMARNRRVESDFIHGTAIHLVDAMRHIAGEVGHYQGRVQTVDGVRWYVGRLAFVGGVEGTLEVLPTAGYQAEEYVLSGADYTIAARVAELDTGAVRVWERGELVVDEPVAPLQPEFVRCGAYGETAEFMAALQEGRPPQPGPADVLPSVEICDALGQLD